MPAEAKTSLDLLVEEAARQLNICNACRYCEGYCAVFPALERRNLLAESDVTQLANLCHDCRACFDACMYIPPHEFALNLPKVLSEARLESYERYVWPARVPRLFRGWLGVFAGAVVSAVVLVVIALSTVGPAALVATPDGAWSPYEVIPYPALLAVIFAVSIYAVAVMVVAARRFWVDVGGNTLRFRFGAVWRAVVDSLSLRNLRGGGEDCYYPDDERPSPVRRRLHGLVAYGFGLCTLSTISAAILEHLLGSEPPYPVVSVPVISGLIGGIGIVIGCTGLLRMKAASSKVTSFAEMTIKDYGLLVALHFLALSGLATFLVRDTAAFGIVFLVHIASVALTFAVAPYSKFVHLVYRFLALVRDNLE
jgi:citrate/tricarballylate utilization protein